MSASNLESPTSRIRKEAHRLGFFKIGIAQARPLPGKEHFEQWLASDMQGEMRYMDRQASKRMDPALVLEDARSLVVVAMNYYSGHGLMEDPLRGKISRYAWGDDYHRPIKDRLQSLAGFIEDGRPDARSLCYVDTGPVMEKVWGAQTTLGWMGKHTNLITREQGSWFFIGVILSNLVLGYDVAERDFCGTCNRCIPACPTGAIVAPYVVDARLCISYLTIELPGSIPRNLRPLIGNRIFGCDDCQEVCPWNRFAVRSEEQSFQPSEGNWMPELAPLVSITAEEFNRRFKHSPVRRAKREGFVRNVVVALGNSKNPKAIPSLRQALTDPSSLVRGHAAWALGQIGTREAVRVLIETRAREADVEVLEEIEGAVCGRGEEVAVDSSFGKPHDNSSLLE